MPSIKCPHCGLVNFATEESCKRCRSSLANVVFSSDGNTLNININFQPPAQTSLPPAATQAQLQDDEAADASYRLPRFPHGSFQPQFNQAPVIYPPNQHGYFNPPAVNQPVYPQNYPNQSGNGAWRSNQNLLIHKNGTLPERCVKCNDHVYPMRNGLNVRQKFRWHNPLLYIALLSPVIYIILACVLSQTVSVDLPLCGRHVAERDTVKNYLLGGGAFAFLFVFFLGYFGAVGLSFLIGIGSIIGISMAYEYLYKPLRIAKIENDYIHLKGADTQFLDSLPYC